MKDLTKGSISSHLIAMAVPMAAGMIFQTLYFFVDLYFVANSVTPRLRASVRPAMRCSSSWRSRRCWASVRSRYLSCCRPQRPAGCESHLQPVAADRSAVRRADSAHRLHVLVGVRAIHRRGRSDGAGRRHLSILVPAGHGVAVRDGRDGLALRGTGIVQPTMVVQVLTLVINTILAPILIAGWGIGRPMLRAPASRARSQL